MKIEWNQNRRGNVHVSDGHEGYWASIPDDWTAEQAVDEFLASANYSAATEDFDIDATILSGSRAGDTAGRRVRIGG